MSSPEALEGGFHYLASSIPASLRRNGRVLTRRDRDGSDAGTEGVEIDRRELRVANGRLDDRPTLVRNGFELLDAPLAGSGPDFMDFDDVVGRYYGECAEIVREATGARQVRAFDHNVRSVEGKRDQTRLRGGQQVQAPARVVHGDYTLTSAPQRLRDLAQPPSENDTYRNYLDGAPSLLDPGEVEQALAPDGRFALINLWRNIADEPVATDPLALCDAQSVRPEDLVVFEIHYADRIGENYFARHSDDHRWLAFPAMQRDEALLIKQWDSAGPLARSEGANADASAASDPCSFSFHTAFSPEGTPEDAPPRWSIEVRCVVFF